MGDAFEGQPRQQQVCLPSVEGESSMAAPREGPAGSQPSARGEGGCQLWRGGPLSSFPKAKESLRLGRFT